MATAVPDAEKPTTIDGNGSPPEHDIPKRPRTATSAATAYFEAANRDLSLFHFVIETVLATDYVAFIAKRALDESDERARQRAGGITSSVKPEVQKISPSELAVTNPGTRTKELRRQRQLLLEMFVARATDNFNRFLVDLIREVLEKQPSILKSRQQSLTIEDILQHTSIDELIRSIIESKVNALSYEGFEQTRDWCGSRGIPLEVADDDLPTLVEGIATRNLIAHSRCVVDEKYVRSVRNTPFKAGELRKLEVDDLFGLLVLFDRVVIATDKTAAKKFKLRRKPLAPKKKPEGMGEAPAQAEHN